MIANDPNVQSVEVIAAALGSLRDELVLVGGCAAGLLIDTPTSPPPRATYDVDLVAVVAALRDYHKLEAAFAERGFQRDASPEAPICRWTVQGIVVDLMPTDEKILGFSNRWYPEAVATALRLPLPSGTLINLIAAPAFLATKLEAFLSRGKRDMLMSHDFEDIINVVEGRGDIVAEVASSSKELRNWIAQQFAEIVQSHGFQHALPGLVAYDDLHTNRVTSVKNKIHSIAGLETP